MVDSEFKNILIIKPSAAGDIICALPVLSALKERFPDARISWLISSHLADLLRGHPMIDELIEFDRRRFGYLAHSWAVTRRFVRFLRQLRQSQYDLVIDLQGLFRSGFLAWTTQAPMRIGPAEKRELGWVFYTDRLPPQPYDTHIVDRILSLESPLGLDFTKPRFPVHIPEITKTKIDDWMNENQLQPCGFVALAPGGTWPSKRWPFEKFARLAERIVEELKLPVVFVGGRAEKHLVESFFAEADRPHCFNLVGKTSLPELLAVLSSAKALVCNDSGPMHMAVALEKPLTAIIGPTNPARTGPYRRPDCVVTAGRSCSPCYKRHCPKTEQSDLPLCMNDITVRQVFDNLKKQLV